MDFFAISNEELENSDFEEDFYICKDCKDKHPIEHQKANCSKKCKPNNCICKPTVLGFYKCREQNYLYSINGRRIE